MNRTLQVHLGEAGGPLGALRHDAQGARENAAFSYDPAWLSAPGRFAIDPALPLAPGPQFHRRAHGGSIFPGAVADTAPDGWGRRVILRDHARRRQDARRAGETVGAAPLTELDFLLAVDDFSRVGALRFRDETGVFQRTVEDGRRKAPPLIDLERLLAASQAVETHDETASDLAYLLGRGTSLGGLRPKCTIVDGDRRLSIGKFPSIADERPVAKGEVLALRLAAAGGLDAAAGRLVESGGQPVALIRRFDRTLDGRRILYISAATLIGAESRDPGEHAYTEIVDALRIHGADAQADIEELWRRIAFSILITNVDDHLLNHGFLHAGGGRWRLSPAFDVNPFPERARELKTWISEDTGPEATIEALMSAAPYFRIPRDLGKTMLARIEQAVAGWREEGRRLGMTGAELNLFADAFEHGEREAARRVAG